MNYGSLTITLTLTMTLTLTLTMTLTLTLTPHNRLDPLMDRSLPLFEWMQAIKIKHFES